VAFIEKTWRTRFPGVPFEYAFLDEAFGRVYRYEEQMGRLLGIVTGLGLAAAFLGLFGLVSFTSRQRRKEIAVRKVIGAPSGRIVALLSRRFVGLIALAGMLAVPAAWWAAKAWLREFAVRIEPGLPVFVFALAVSLLTALAAVLFQGLKASRGRPADVLRHE
jgi:putative ABC transport system permease protein